MSCKLTPISELGEFGLIDRLVKPFENKNVTTVKGVGDDAAVVGCPEGKNVVVTSDMLMEGVDFDLSYFPLKHLGYKAVMVGVSNVLAVGALPSQITLSIALSNKFSVEALEEFYEGVHIACEKMGVDLVGGDTRASLTGLAIAITTIGHVAEGQNVGRGGAQQNDLICITGNLGAAFMGLQLLEREKRVLADVENPEPQFGGYEYLLEQYLRPTARREVVESMIAEKIVPTSMIDIADGLATDLLQICRASNCGARIYLEKIPIAKQTNLLADEMKNDPIVAALNGGGDYQLLFTVPLEKREQIMQLGAIDVIGHITPASTSAYLVTPDGSEIKLKSQPFPEGI